MTEDQTIQLRLSVQASRVKTLNSEVIANGTELLSLLGLQLPSPRPHRHSLNLVLWLRGSASLFKTGMLEDVPELVIERGLYLPKILVKLLEGFLGMGLLVQPGSPVELGQVVIVERVEIDEMLGVRCDGLKLAHLFYYRFIIPPQTPRLI